MIDINEILKPNTNPTIKGDTIQEGIPTPENPISIKGKVITFDGRVVNS